MSNGNGTNGNGISKEAIKAATADAQASGTVYSYDPNDLWVYGVDAPEGFEIPPTTNFADTDTERLKRIDAAMVDSMVNVNPDTGLPTGVVMPIKIRIHEGRPVVTNGRRRVLHARAANERQVKAKLPTIRVDAVLDLSAGDTVSAREQALTANTFAVSHSPVQQAIAAKDLVERYIGQGMSKPDAEKRVAAALGFTKQTLANRFKLLELEPEVQKAIDAGKIGAMAGLKLHGQDPEKQREGLKFALEHAEAQGSTHGTADAAAKATREKDPNAPIALPLKTIRAMLATDAAKQLDPLIVKTMRALLGETALTTVKGLKGCLDEVWAAESEAEEEKAAREKAKNLTAARKAREAEKKAAAGTQTAPDA